MGGAGQNIIIYSGINNVLLLPYNSTKKAIDTWDISFTVINNLAFMKMNTHSLEWKEAADKNAKKIDQEISSLKNDYINMLKRDYTGFWAQVRIINDLFRTLKPIEKDERQKLWERFSSICDDIKRKSADERLKKRVQSQDKKDGIKSLIKETYLQAKGANTRDDLNEAKDKLQMALARMKDGWGGYNLATDLVSSIIGDEGILSKEDRDYCWTKWKEASEAINYRWKELCELSYGEFIKEAWDAHGEANNGDPYEALKKVKGVQTRMKGKLIARDGRQEIFNILEKAWQTASNKIRDKKEEKVRKQDEWRDRMHSHIERWENQVSNTEGLIDRIRSQIDDLEGKASNARTADFADRVRGWIQEKYDFINKLQSQISALEDKIRSVKDKLND